MTNSDQFSIRTLLGIVAAISLVLAACVALGIWVLVPVLFILVTAVAWFASDPPPGDHLSFPFRLALVAPLSHFIGATSLLLLASELLIKECVEIAASIALIGVPAGLVAGAISFYVVKCGQRKSLFVAEGVSLFCAVAVLLKAAHDISRV